ncbi:SRPBCC family protein [Paenibacillus sp. DMB20]|uniref:SRPBCC family protein n=1 Tax=Paenibacillus sp. DMB20 TaxID=1642570 RepID=UPI000627F7B4|nr:SRPBCC domain-containing protein [Paenibacillus sp. DMB20]KKO52847.1 ATPase [Paenibacillus sp. DMB20]KKO53796.1 ATPase [Paenibacillus sp. DMB20]
MAGSIFKRDVKTATGSSWEEWIMKLGREVDPLWSHEQIKNHIREAHQVSGDWSEWIAVMYEQIMGRTPVGTTKDAGVQIGIRKTFAATKEKAWNFLTSSEGLSLWIGEVPSFKIQKGHEYESKEGVSGKITVVVPYQKLRMTWKRPEWDSPSRLQIYLLSASSGKTTISIHQEMLEDVYMREMMRRYWEETLNRIKNLLEARDE